MCLLPRNIAITFEPLQVSGQNLGCHINSKKVPLVLNVDPGGPLGRPPAPKMGLYAKPISSLDFQVIPTGHAFLETRARNSNSVGSGILIWVRGAVKTGFPVWDPEGGVKNFGIWQFFIKDTPSQIKI